MSSQALWSSQPSVHTRRGSASSHAAAPLLTNGTASAHLASGLRCSQSLSLRQVSVQAPPAQMPSPHLASVLQPLSQLVLLPLPTLFDVLLPPQAAATRMSPKSENDLSLIMIALRNRR
jgi:hypothetical protein